MKQFLGRNIIELGVGLIVALLILDTVLPYVAAQPKAESISSAVIIAEIHKAANQYRVQTSKIEQLNHQQCESDRMAMATHSQLVAGLATMAQNMALLNKSMESLQRTVERNAGP